MTEAELRALEEEGIITFRMAHYGEERELRANKDEEVIAGLFLKLLKTYYDDIDFELVRKSESYLTILMRNKKENGGDSDLIRFKYTDKAKWVSVYLTNEDNKENRDNPLFEAQKNKNQMCWKSKIKTYEDIFKYKDFILNYIEAVLNSDYFER